MSKVIQRRYTDFRLGEREKSIKISLPKFRINKSNEWMSLKRALRKFVIGCDKAAVVQSDVCKVQNLQYAQLQVQCGKARKLLRELGDGEAKCRLYLLCRHCEHCVHFIVTALYWYALSIMGVVYIIHYEMHCTYVEVRKGAS